MLSDKAAQATIAVKDVARARKFYAEALGLKELPGMGDNVALFESGGTKIVVYKSDYAGTAGHTLISFKSPDLVADMRTLRAKGVEFIDYDLPGLKTVNGMAEFGPVKNAWVNDSEGNILGFVEGM